MAYGRRRFIRDVSRRIDSPTCRGGRDEVYVENRHQGCPYGFGGRQYALYGDGSDADGGDDCLELVVGRVECVGRLPGVHDCHHLQ